MITINFIHFMLDRPHNVIGNPLLVIHCHNYLATVIFEHYSYIIHVEQIKKS